MIIKIEKKIKNYIHWFFIFLLIVIIFVFVCTIGILSPNVTLLSELEKNSKYYGINLKDYKINENLKLKTEISFLLNNQNDISMNAKIIQKEIFVRIATLYWVIQYKISKPSEEEFRRYIQGKSIFQNSNGFFSQYRYSKITKTLQKSMGASASLIAEAIREEYCIEKFKKILAGPGYILPFEKNQQINNLSAKWNITLTNFKLENFNPKVQYSLPILKRYYQKIQKNYQLSEKIIIDYILFPFIGYSNKKYPINKDDLIQYYNNQKLKFNKRYGPFINFELIRNQININYAKDRAFRFAAESADFFIKELYNKKIISNFEALYQILQNKNIKHVVLSLYKDNYFFNNKKLQFLLIDKVFSLNKNNFYSEVFFCKKGAAIMFFNYKQKNFYLPSINKVKDKVFKFYYENKKDILFYEYKKELNRKILFNNIQLNSLNLLKKEGLTNIFNHKSFTILDIPNSLSKVFLQYFLRINEKKIISIITAKSKKEKFLYIKEKKNSSYYVKNNFIKKIIEKDRLLTTHIIAQKIILHLTKLGISKN